MIKLIIVLTFTYAQTKASEQQPSYYDLCAPFRCGNVTFGFPFSPSDMFGSNQFDCGLPRFEVACDKISSVPTIQPSGRAYQVKEVYVSDNLVQVVDNLLIGDVSLGSCSSFGNLTISGANNGAGSRFMLPIGGVNLTIFECPNGVTLSDTLLKAIIGNYSCSGVNSMVYFWDGTRVLPQTQSPWPHQCSYISLPVSATSLPRLTSLNGSSNDGARTILTDVLRDGFPLQWNNVTDCVNCQNIGGRCGYDSSSKKILCFCKGNCATIGSTFALLALVFMLMFKYRRRISTISKSSISAKNQKIDDVKTAKEFVKTYQSTMLSNYSYAAIKKMTNGFKEKLGEGGYGNVYKGKLLDGRLVAVKMLENYKEDTQSFLNEVTTIGYMYHVNVIRLLGFCWDGSKQALIYEYMSNKSLGDLISKPNTIGLTKLLEVAIGAAHGIEYLHNGCESRILHLDIKPHNVLLDQKFIPKISDFGLAKVYSRDQSAVTMTRARGTIGYIAPEVFMRNLGKPSDKADVYSFGMLLFEMVGAKRHVEPIESDLSESYFPDWIYDKLVQEERDYSELNDSIIGDEVNIERKMVMVGLWCIQMNPRDRPTMTRVIEMLTGDVEGIEMPPKPFNFSFPREPFEQEITSIESESCELPLTSGSLEMQSS